MPLFVDVVKKVSGFILTIAIILGVVFTGNYIWQKLTYEDLPEDPTADGPILVNTLEVKFPEETEEDEDPSQPQNPSALTKTGFIVADQEVQVYPEISALVKDIKVKEGDTVQKGQVLAVIGDSIQLKSSIASYNAAIASLNTAQQTLQLTAQTSNLSVSTFQNQIRSAETNLIKAQEQLRSNQIVRYETYALEDAQTNLTQLQTSLAEEQAAQQAAAQTAAQPNINAYIEQIQNALNSYHNAASDSSNTEEKQYSDYLQDRIDSKQNYIQDQSRFIQETTGRAQDTQSILSINDTYNQIDLLTKQMANARLQGDIQILGVRSQIIQLQSQLESAKINLSAGQITAPTSGVITSLPIKIGERVSQQSPLFTVTDLNSIVLNTSLTPDEAFQLDQNAEVTIQIGNQTLPARITNIGLTADPMTKTIPVEISAQAINLRLIPNTFAKVIFAPAEQNQQSKQEPQEPQIKNYFALPISIMSFQGGGFNVPVIENGTLVYKKVTLAGPIKNGIAPVAKGELKDGDIVINQRLFGLPEGTLVESNS